MGNAFLANIRGADAICQVTRVFDDEDEARAWLAADEAAETAQ